MESQSSMDTVNGGSIISLLYKGAIVQFIEPIPVPIEIEHELPTPPLPMILSPMNDFERAASIPHHILMHAELFTRFLNVSLYDWVKYKHDCYKYGVNYCDGFLP